MGGMSGPNHKGSSRRVGESIWLSAGQAIFSGSTDRRVEESGSTSQEELTARLYDESKYQAQPNAVMQNN